MILVCVAHDDDFVLGCGGSIYKYAKEGKNVVVLVFSSGEGSDPLLKKELIKDIRGKEAEKAGKFLGVREIVNLGIPDMRINSKDKKQIETVQKLIKKYKPKKVFTHSASDPHKDHQAVYKTVKNVLNNKKIELYTFGVWNPINVIKTNLPRLIVDVSGTFRRKLKALKMFKSQKMVMFQLKPSIYLKAKIYGYVNKCKYAEVFYKEK